MKISFSQGKKSMVPMVRRGRWLNPVAFGLVALWPHITPWAHWHGEHHCGVTLGLGAGGVCVQTQPVGLGHSAPTLLLLGD